LLDDASSAHRKLDPADGLQDAQLDDGARVHIVHRDVARGGHVLVNVRKFTGIPFASLDELVEGGMLTARVAAFLRACVHARLSIVFAGHPGAGKTTLMSCTAAELDPALRVVVAEEVFEADIPLPNVAHMQTRAARSDREPVDLRRLVAGFLRMAPDVAIVGEVRDREGLPEIRAHGRAARLTSRSVVSDGRPYEDRQLVPGVVRRACVSSGRRTCVPGTNVFAAR
jgi:pilus assembly protein CpaF